MISNGTPSFLSSTFDAQAFSPLNLVWSIAVAFALRVLDRPRCEITERHDFPVKY